MRQRVVEIDLVKIVACVCVIGLHTLQMNSEPIIFCLFHLCGCAVPIFFMTSGFFIYNRSNISFDNYKTKVLKILRIIFSWCIILSILDSIVRYNSNGFFNFFCINLFGSITQKNGGLWHFWYLWALIICYIINFIILRVVREDKYKVLFRIWLLLLVGSYSIQIISYLEARPIQGDVIQTLRIWTWTQYAILGYLIRSRIQDIKNRISIEINGVLLCIFTAIVIIQRWLINNGLSGLFLPEFFYDDLLTVIWIVLLFVFIYRISERVISDRRKDLIVSISALTFGCYIIHVFLRRLVIHFIEPYSVVGSLVLWLFITVISFACTWIIKKIPLFAKLVEM